MIKDIEKIIKKLPTLPIYLDEHNSDYTERIIHNAIIMGYESYYDKKDPSTDLDLINLINTCKDISCELHCRSGLYYYLSDLQHSLMTMWRYSKKERSQITEKDLEQELIKKWDSTILSDKYVFIKSQYSLPDQDLMDIYAKTIEGEQPVIIELKKGNKNGYRQLRSYAVFFDNPILINISEKPVVKKKKGIIYYLFDELDKQYSEIKETLRPLFERKVLNG